MLAANSSPLITLFGSACALVLLGLHPQALAQTSFTIGTPAQRPGAWDGSAALPVGDGYFIAATDEENVFRRYGPKGGAQVVLTFSAAIEATPKKKGFEEADLEGAATIGDVTYWIGSHGQDKKGEDAKDRQVLMTTKVKGAGKEATLEYQAVYRGLRSALLEAPSLKSFDLEAASKKAPKQEGAFNIESLCADGTDLLIGFRSPIPQGKALLVRLKNPAALMTKTPAAPEFGPPELVELGGLGFRDMLRWETGFIIVAGDYRARDEQGARTSELFWWEPGQTPRKLSGDLKGFYPEGLIALRTKGRTTLLLLSDEEKKEGVAPTFRTVELTLNK